MRTTNVMKNVIVTVFLFLGILVSANAQQNPLKVCETRANQAVSLKVDVLGKDYQQAQGHWDYVKNTVGDAGSYTNPATQAIEQKVSNIFVLTGKKPGTYKFVFTATKTTSCITKGEKAMATVIIEEVAKDAATKLSLCENTAGTLDLKTIISSTFPNPKFFELDPAAAGAVTADGVLTVDANFEGTISVKYNSGDANKACNQQATVTIDVTRDGEAPAVLAVGGSKSITYCVNQVPASLNLNQYLTTMGNPKGTWSEKTGSANVSLDGATGVVTFTTPTNGDEYKFEYTFANADGDCYTGTTLTDAVVIKIKGDLKEDFKAKEKELCKNKTPNRVIDMLRDGLDVAIPLSSGTWRRIEEQTKMDIKDGMFHVAKANAGKYKYVFKVSNVTGNVCGLAGSSATLTLNIFDPSAYEDSRIKFCQENVNAATGSINLADYVNNLSPGVKWTSPDGGITTTEAGEVSYADLKAVGLGTYEFDYTYTSAECGDAEGKLYLTITDDLNVVENQALAYCRPDMQSPVKLNAIVGISVPGTWSTTGDAVIANANAANATFEEPTGVDGNDKTYTLKFTPTSNNCGAKTITLTIAVNTNSYK